ncbi:MAG: transcriptional regulator [Desulfitobacteriaceae bacterium]|nr:transcriptional regulator [Desulfitobacteriaceae bacterium]MDD4752750.1 transcriptional regulator [Desulfitobacteriaceae bacterium]
MFFELRNRNKTVKELRKNQGYTAQELAVKLKVDTPVILKIDNLRLKEVPLKIKSKMLPVLRGDYMNKIPW